MKALCRIICFIAFFPSLVGLSQQVAPPLIKWQKCIGGTGSDVLMSAVKTVDHGFILVGYTTSNDGDVSGNHGNYDGWVVKLNSEGSIEWQRCIGGSDMDMLNHVTECPNGDFICVGTTYSTDGDVQRAANGLDAWVVRISKTGTLLWNKAYGGIGNEWGSAIRRAWDGGYVIAGKIANASNDVWLLKIDESGALQWQQSSGTAGEEDVSSMIAYSDSSYIITANTSSNSVYPGCSPLYSVSAYFLTKISKNGNILWQQSSGLTCFNPGYSKWGINTLELPSHQLLFIEKFENNSIDNNPHWQFWQLDPQNGNQIKIYSNGTFNTDELLNSSVGPDVSALMPDSSIITGTLVMNSYSPSNRDATLSQIKLIENPSPTAAFLYRKFYGGSSSDEFYGVVPVNEGEVLACGVTGSNDGVVSGNHGNGDAWVVKFVSQNSIKGRVFIDANNNGVYDAGEKYFANARVESVKGNRSFASITDSTGRFINNVDTGSYSTSVKIANAYYTIQPSSKSSIFTTYNQSDSFDFALAPIAGIKDLKISLVEENAIRPGSTSRYRISYANQGTSAVSNVVLKITKHSRMSFLSSVPAPTSVVNDTIVWNIGLINPFSSGDVHLLLNASGQLQSGDNISLVGVIEPITGDNNPVDNNDTLTQTVRSSFDPNDKNENSNGILPPDQVQSKFLTYTIRFQNTGTDTAFNIIVRDTLSSKLDSTSITMVASSHPYQLSIKDGTKLTWTFTDIKLPDSNHNEPASHGYLAYQIKPKSSLVFGDSIQNTASVYFDYNLPVRTNTQITVVKLAPPSQPIVSGIQSSYCSNQGTQKGKITNLPVANSGTTAMVKLDGNNLPIAADSTFSFDVSTLSAGQHQLIVIFTNSTAADSVLKTFSVTTAVTPDVNVSANITHITNLANNVIVTATNASGGGNAPLYTFAADRSFVTILQAEGSSSTLNINPSTLQVGDNWIYVRMKTNAACYTTQTNIDSILLNRDAVTGIIDVDDPSKIISIYPNPFNKLINLTGLSNIKKYEITIVDLNGKLILRRQVQNSSQVNIPLRSFNAGVYFLNLYDIQKQKLIGTIPLLKQ